MNDGNFSWYITKSHQKSGRIFTVDRFGIMSERIQSHDLTPNIYQLQLNDPEKGTKQGVNIALAGNVEKGVWKSNVKAAAIIDAYWFASVTTKKGIFDKDAVTLTSEAVPVAQKSADTINLVEDSTTATSATVKFTNLRANGTVYIVRGLKERTDAGKGTNAWNGTDYFSAPDKVFKAYEAGINEAIVGKEEVEAGAASVTVAQTISEYETNAEALPDTALGTNTAGYFPVNNYIAVFVPDDEDNYGMIYTTAGFKNKATKEDSESSTDSQGLSLTQVATSLSYDKKTPGTITGDGTSIFTITAPTLIAKDQFGNAMVTAQATADVTSVVANNADATDAESGVAKFDVAENGQVKVYLNVTGPTNNGDGYTITVLGTTIKVTNKFGADIAAGATTPLFEVKVGDDTLKAVPSALGTAKITFQTITTEIGKQGTFATVDDYRKYANGATLKVQESVNGMAWTDLANGGLVNNANTITEDNSGDPDIKANTYYRIVVTAAGCAPAYVNMEGGKTAEAKFNGATVATATEATATTTPAATAAFALTVVVDQFGDQFTTTDGAISLTASGDDYTGSVTGTISNSAAGQCTITFTAGDPAPLAGQAYTFTLGGKTGTYTVVTGTNNDTLTFA